MGQEYMNDEKKVEQAIFLCVELGAIEECEHHSGIYIDQQEYGAVDLKTLILDKKPEAVKSFENKEEMTVYIQQAINDAGTECGSCAKNKLS